MLDTPILVIHLTGFYRNILGKKWFLTRVFSVVECREHGVVGDMRDAWPSARVRKNVSLIRTYHGFKGTTCFDSFTLLYLFREYET
jgi:hypothetical protein